MSCCELLAAGLESFACGGVVIDQELIAEDVFFAGWNTPVG